MYSKLEKEESTCLVFNDTVLWTRYVHPALDLRKIGQLGWRELADAYSVALLVRPRNGLSQMGYHREVLS